MLLSSLFLDSVKARFWRVRGDNFEISRNSGEISKRLWKGKYVQSADQKGLSVVV